MSIAILSPLPGDTVMSPVTVSTAYDFGSGSYTIAATVTGGSPSTSGSLMGNGVYSTPVSTASTGPATATSTPSGGGSQNSVAFNLGSMMNPPPIIIETIDPNPLPVPPPTNPAPGPTLLKMVKAGPGRKTINAKGSIKGTNITRVDYRVLQLNLSTLSWSVVVPFTQAKVGGNNWHENGIQFLPVLNCAYALQVVGITGTGGTAGQFTKAIEL